MRVHRVPRRTAALGFLVLATAGFERLAAQGAPETVLLGETVRPAWVYLRDPDRRLDMAAAFAEYEGGRFQAPPQALPSFGFTKDAVWLAMSVRNAGPHGDWHLLVDYAILDRVTFGDPVGKRTIESGDRLPFAAREVAHRAFAFPLLSAKGERRTFLVRLESSSSLVAPLSIERTVPLHQNQDLSTLLHGLVLGLFFVMALYNAFVFASIRERAYFHYVAYIVSLGIFFACFSGIGARYLWPDSPLVANYVHSIAGGLALTFGLLFSYEFLGAARAFPVWRWGLRALLAINVAATVAAPFTGNVYTNRLTLIEMVIIIVTAIVSLVRKNRAARYMLLAWTGYAALAVAWVLAANGFLPSPLLFEYGLQAGALLEVVLLSLALADRINILRREREAAFQREIDTKRRLLDSFSRFVPTQFIGMLGRDSVEDVQLGEGVRRSLTILFCDIRDFTGLSERMTVDDNFRFLNAYLGRMGPIIQERRGFIDKFIGDAVMAIFTTADDALDAAVEMLRALRKYNMHRSAQGYDPIRLGVGLHSGDVMLGTIGSFSRMDSTVIGDTVNLASRIEGLTKRIGLPLLLSDDVRRSLSDPGRYSLREVAAVRARGKTQRTILYECWDFEDDPASEGRRAILADYVSALALYRQHRYAEALTGFEKCLAVADGDPPSRAYAAKCRELAG